MYVTDQYLYLRERGELAMHSADIWSLLVFEGSSALVTVAGIQGEPSVATLDGYSNLLECNLSNYVRKAISGRAVSINTASVPHRLELSHTAVEWTDLGQGDTRVGGAIWYVKGASDALSVPIIVFDNRDTFPFVGGTSLLISSPATGAIQASLG